MSFNTHITNYIIKELNPTIGETIYDPNIGSGDLIVSTINYLNEKHENHIVWERNKHTIHGCDLSNDLTIVHEKLEQIINTVDFSDTINCNIINSNNKYDIVVSNIDFLLTSTAFSFIINHIISSIKDNGRCAIIIPHKFLVLNDNKFIELRKDIVDNFNLTKVVAIDYNYSILFFNKSTRISNRHNIIFTDLIDMSEVYDSTISHDYIQSNRYMIFDDTELPPLIPCDSEFRLNLENNKLYQKRMALYDESVSKRLKNE